MFCYGQMPVNVLVKSRDVLHPFTGSLVGIHKLPALAGWYIRFGIFFTVRFGGSSILWNFVGTPICKFSRNLFFPQKGGLVHQKGGRKPFFEGKKGFPPNVDTITKRPDQVFLWYRLGKYRENTKQYWTKIPNQGTTLVKSACRKSHTPHLR